MKINEKAWENVNERVPKVWKAHHFWKNGKGENRFIRLFNLQNK